MRVRCLPFLFAALAVSGVAQLRLPGGHDVQIPGLGGGSNEAITTSIKDAKFEAVDKDGFNPTCADLFGLERTLKGGFILKAGAYGAQVQSYCLHAGTHGPVDGDGYLYAPVKGPLAKTVTHVVQNSVSHPEIEQHDVQALLWAMQAHVKITDMNSHMQSVATTLLTSQEMFDINGGALGLLTDDRIGGMFIKQPPILRQAMEAEARLRNALSGPGGSYEDLERIAVLSGDPNVKGPGSRDVPAGRWSLHPDGYYVRYIPSGYPSTRLEIFVPEGSKAIGKEFDPATQIATPANTSRQRLIQSGRLKRQ